VLSDGDGALLQVAAGLGQLDHQRQRIATHESPRTTKLYDRTSDQVTLDEIEKIQI
jgi:hypothetical protein